MRLRRIAIVVGILAVLSGIAFFFLPRTDPDAPRSDWPTLRAATPSNDVIAVNVSRDTCISGEDNDGDYWECVIAADPSDASRLCAAVMLRGKKGAGADVLCFYSHDRGSTWQTGCRRSAPTGRGFGDPSIAFGTGGEVFLVHMDSARGSTSADEAVDSLMFLKSPDGGRSWEGPLVAPTDIDRPWLAAATDDASQGDSGVMYCVGQIMHRSPEGSVTHAEPIFGRLSGDLIDPVDWITPHSGRTIINCRPSQPAVFSDGSVLIAYLDPYLKRTIHTMPRPAIYTMRSIDGGRTFDALSTVENRWWHDRIASTPSAPEGVDFPQLAVDRWSTTYKDQVYCVWSDGSGDDNTTRIFFSRSADYGVSWTQPVVLSEQAMESGVEQDYMTFVPAIAVSNRGVIAVTWYDRRGLPLTKRVPFSHEGAASNSFQVVAEGWNLRVRVSIDGGDTWAPSVQVNEEPGHGRVSVGHTVGLAADANGSFHAAWIDNRTDLNQLWTSMIEVDVN